PMRTWSICRLCPDPQQPVISQSLNSAPVLRRSCYMNDFRRSRHAVAERCCNSHLSLITVTTMHIPIVSINWCLSTLSQCRMTRIPARRFYPARGASTGLLQELNYLGNTPADMTFHPTHHFFGVSAG